MNLDLPIVKPHEVGMSETRLGRIKPLIEQYISKQLIPGAITMAARHGKIVHFEVQGYSSVENRKPMAPDTIFRMASMTKPVTSAALMMLFEHGKFQLRDPIAKFLPAFKEMKVAESTVGRGYNYVPAKRPIEVRDILTHTAGFVTEYNPKLQAEYRAAAKFRSRNEVIGDFVDRLAKLPLIHQPGEIWDYSRATCVVGRLVEVLSGQTLAEYFQQHIFEPLGMTDTHFFLPEEKLSRFASAYEPGEDFKIRLTEAASMESFYLSKPGIYYMGSGGLVSTASDYFKFANMLMQKGKAGDTRLLSRKTVELMTMNHIGDRPVWLTGPGIGFGLGFSVSLNRGETHAMDTEGSYSWGGAFCTYWWNDPVEELFGMMLTQVRPYLHLNLRADFRTVVTQAVDD
jgi:CubicO group peptidase (beta-lactamase class C family)